MCIKLFAYLAEPELEIFDGGGVHALSVGLFELLALLGRLGRQVLPLLGELSNTLSNAVLRASTLALVDELCRVQTFKGGLVYRTHYLGLIHTNAH